MTRSTISFVVLGKPQQRGSKQASVRYGRDGKPISKDGRVLTFAKDMNEKSSEWMNLVRDKAAEAMKAEPIMRGAVVLTVKFYFTRPNSPFGSGKNLGKLKPKAPRDDEYANVPDLSKLLRCIEDGMSKVVYADDRQICRYGPGTGKYWTDSMSRAEITVEACQEISMEIAPGPIVSAQ